MAARYKSRVSFTVPATAGQYAPERITFPETFSATTVPDVGLLGITALIESNAATGATLELWLPKIGATGIDADYTFSGISASSGLLYQALASFPGAQLRAKSAGVAGAMVVSATAD